MFDKSFYSLARKILTGRDHIRVAVVGAKESGKTVFLTALINHLRNHDANLLDLHRWAMNRLEENLTPSGGISSFQYAHARAQLSNGEWPDNTTGLSVAREKVRLTKKEDGKREQRRTVVVELLDLPGERVADLSMVGRSFREWSAWMENRFCGVEGESAHYREYARSASSAHDKQKILSAYKECVVKQYADGLLTITPSVLKLSLDGDFRGGVKVDDFRKNIVNVPVGLDENNQFAPLPQEYFKERSKECRQIVKAFDKAFDRYKARIVAPIADWLHHANKAIYLIDVLSLLRRGPEAYNAERDFASQTLRLFRRACPDNGILRGVQQFLGSFVRTHADGVYVVATKSDTVVGKPNRSRMKDLARGLLKDTLPSLGVTNVEVQSCASVVTSAEYRDEKALKARVQIDRQSGEPQVEEKQYKVSDVPMRWPDDDEWNRMSGNNMFDFRPTFPKFDKKLDTPPPHLGLEVLVRCLLSIS